MTIQEYIDAVAAQLDLPERVVQRIRRDLENELFELVQAGADQQQAIEKMGPVEEVAAKLNEKYADTRPRPKDVYKRQEQIRRRKNERRMRRAAVVLVALVAFFLYLGGVFSASINLFSDLLDSARIVPVSYTHLPRSGTKILFHAAPL